MKLFSLFPISDSATGRSHKIYSYYVRRRTKSQACSQRQFGPSPKIEHLIEESDTIRASLSNAKARRLGCSIMRPLRAEALACEANERGWILISADVCGFSRPLTDVVREDIAQRTGLSATEVMITATHTHSGPHVTDALWCERSEMESAYFALLRNKRPNISIDWEESVGRSFRWGHPRPRLKMLSIRQSDHWGQKIIIHTSHFHMMVHGLGSIVLDALF